MKEVPLKILVVVLDNLGDTVMATAVTAALQSLFPKGEIGFWVKEYAAGLLQNQPDVTLVHASDPFWDTSPGRSKGRFSHFMKTLADIRAASYDVAMVLNTEWRRSLAVRLTGIPIRIGYDRRQSRPFLTHVYAHHPAGRHFVDDHLGLIGAWAGRLFTKEKFPPHLSAPSEPNKHVVLHPFSGDPERKNWPLPHWLELIKNLSDSVAGLTFAVVGSEREARELHSFRNILSEHEWRLVIDRPLSELLTLLAGARLFVGGDSGPGHMAAALGTPTLSLFGAFDPSRSRPLGNGRVEILHHNPLKTLSVRIVEEKILEMLKG